MSAWNKLVVVLKFLFGGFEAATDYLLALLNAFLAQGNIPEHVQKAREYVNTILGYIRKYEKYCPAIWVPYYEKLEASVQTLTDMFEDGQISPEELEKAIADVKAAIAEWMK